MPEEAELETEFGLRPAQVDALRELFRGMPKVCEVTIYGSRAKGTQRVASDIDLCLHGSELTFSDLARAETAIDELGLPYMTDLSLFDAIEDAGLKAQIERTGKPFFVRASDRIARR